MFLIDKNLFQSPILQIMKSYTFPLTKSWICHRTGSPPILEKCSECVDTNNDIIDIIQ